MLCGVTQQYCENESSEHIIYYSTTHYIMLPNTHHTDIFHRCLHSHPQDFLSLHMYEISWYQNSVSPWRWHFQGMPPSPPPPHLNFGCHESHDWMCGMNKCTNRHFYTYLHHHESYDSMCGMNKCTNRHFYTYIIIMNPMIECVVWTSALTVTSIHTSSWIQWTWTSHCWCLGRKQMWPMPNHQNPDKWSLSQR